MRDARFPVTASQFPWQIGSTWLWHEAPNAISAAISGWGYCHFKADFEFVRLAGCSPQSNLTGERHEKHNFSPSRFDRAKSF